jgi:hypothetical protein
MKKNTKFHGAYFHSLVTDFCILLVLSVYPTSGLLGDCDTGDYAKFIKVYPDASGQIFILG